jgi:hypothetical protein
MPLVGYVALVREIRKAYKILLGNPKGNRPLGKPRCRQQENIKIEFKGGGYEDTDSVHSAQNVLHWFSISSTTSGFYEERPI